MLDTRGFEFYFLSASTKRARTATTRYELSGKLIAMILISCFLIVHH